jgi:hypothetical protein
MLDQVTLIDAPKVANYEKYTKRLTQLILMNMTEFAETARVYLIKTPDGKYKSITVPFPSLDMEALSCYTISISSELPKNKARIAQMANTLMEKQMQYNQTGERVHFITPEEWIMLQDLPIKEFMLKRMGIERSNDYTERVSEILMTFAELTKQGVNPRDALSMTAEQMRYKDSSGMVPEEQPQFPQAVQENNYPAPQQPVNFPME